MALITTTKGLVSEEALRKRLTRTEVHEQLDGEAEAHIETANAIEYYDGDELVHRSVHLTKHKVAEDIASVLQQMGA